jgi:hypothetical protein
MASPIALDTIIPLSASPFSIVPELMLRKSGAHRWSTISDYSVESSIGTLWA